MMCCWIAEDMDMESARSGCLMSVDSFMSPELSSPVTVLLSASLLAGSLLTKRLIFHIPATTIGPEIECKIIVYNINSN